MVSMSLFKEPTVVRGTVSAIIADNLPSHEIGGFKVGFSKGFRKFRFCMATDEDIQTKFFDCEFLSRSKEQHNLLIEHFQRVYGINSNSIFNKLQFFHVIGGLVPDVMHSVWNVTD